MLIGIARNPNSDHGFGGSESQVINALTGIKQLPLRGESD
jgi:hypothetical protein